MAVLSDADLTRMYPESQPGPASIDLHVGDTLLVWPYWVPRDPHTDQSDTWKALDLTDLGDGPAAWILKPGNRYLAATRERIVILPTHAAQIAARSSWGRDGLAVICGPAGWIDPGYEGCPTLELSVVGSALLLRPGDRVAQIVLHELASPCERPYQGRYQQDTRPTPSRHHQEAHP